LLDLGSEVLDGLLEVDERNPSDQVALLAGGLVGKGSCIEQTSLTGLGVPLYHGINLLIGDRQLGRDALEGSLIIGCGLIASCEGQAGSCKKGGSDKFHRENDNGSGTSLYQGEIETFFKLRLPCGASVGEIPAASGEKSIRSFSCFWDDASYIVSEKRS